MGTEVSDCWSEGSQLPLPCLWHPQACPGGRAHMVPLNPPPPSSMLGSQVPWAPRQMAPATPGHGGPAEGFATGIPTAPPSKA